MLLFSYCFLIWRMVGEKMTKAIALLSGGLDSILAIKVIQEQGIEVIGMVFVTPFFSDQAARKAVEQLNIPLEVVNITDEYLAMLPNPKHGHGSQMNPCIDCHAMMMRKAGEMLERLGANFIITGEVLGERPMSQSPKGLGLVESHSGLQGYILRPLSAKLLEPTIPEQEGLVDRERLLDIHGRSRKRQFELAKHYGITEYPTPAGGCLLTDPGFSKRLKELMQYPNEYQVNDLEMLKVGRHFRAPSLHRVVVGRNKEENQTIRDLATEKDYLLQVEEYPGPITLVRGEGDKATIELAAALTVRYSDGKDKGGVKVRVSKITGQEETLKGILPLEQEQIEEMLIGK